MKNVSEHAKMYWKHVLECLKIVFEKVEKSWKKVEKSWKKLKKVEKSWKMFLESSRIWCTKIMTWKTHISSQIRPQKTKVWTRRRTRTINLCCSRSITTGIEKSCKIGLVNSIITFLELLAVTSFLLTWKLWGLDLFFGGMINWVVTWWK